MKSIIITPIIYLRKKRAIRYTFRESEGPRIYIILGSPRAPEFLMPYIFSKTPGTAKDRHRHRQGLDRNQATLMHLFYIFKIITGFN